MSAPRTPAPPPGTLDAALARAAEAAVEAAAARLGRPLYVSQRTVASVVGLPARAFLRLARAGAFACSRERRLVLARTDDVVAFVEARVVHRDEKPANDHLDDEAAALARVGARRT